MIRFPAGTLRATPSSCPPRPTGNPPDLPQPIDGSSRSRRTGAGSAGSVDQLRHAAARLSVAERPREVLAGTGRAPRLNRPAATRHADRTISAERASWRAVQRKQPNQLVATGVSVASNVSLTG